MELFIVHDGGQREHFSSDELFTELGTWPGDKPITDAMAQTIAAWWLDGRNTLSMVLATSGRVDRRMNRETFADAASYSAAGQGDRFALDRLVDYIEYHIAVAPSAARACACRDCFDIVYGIVGDLCSGCTDAGCEYDSECDQVGDVYGPGHDQGMHALCITESGYCD